MGKTAFIFPGQGSQVVGMGRDLVEISDHAAQVFDRAGRVVGFDLAKVCFEGPAERLESTDIQQPAILTTCLAFWAALTRGGAESPQEPWAAAGLSLGEYTALHIAGAMPFEDAVRLLYKRGQYMQEASWAAPGGLVSIIGLEAPAVEDLCAQAAQGQVLQPANYNCPGQIVISGAAEACRRAMASVEASGKGKAVALKVSGAFHSDLMKPAADKLKHDLDQTPFAAPAQTVISNVDARPHEDAGRIRDRLYRQVFCPVRWQQTIEELITRGFVRFVEIGPGRVLSGLVRKIDRRATVVNINTGSSLQEFVAAARKEQIQCA